MTRDIEELRRDYRDMAAPGNLAGRIAARAQPPKPAIGWLPAAVAAMVGLAVLVTPLVFRDETVVREASVPRTASTAPLSRVTAAKPALAAPSLGGMRSLSRPKLPSRPRLAPAAQPPKQPDMESHRMEEPSHDYV